MDYFYFLLKDHIVGPRRLDIINQYGVKAGISDYAALLHCGASDMVNPRLGSCAGWWWTMSPCADNVYMVFDSGNVDYCPTDVDNRGIRPAIKYSKIASYCTDKKVNDSGVPEVCYGEYPQTIVDSQTSSKLEELFQSGNLSKTGKSYTKRRDRKRSPRFPLDREFSDEQVEEFELDGNKYVRVVGSLCEYESTSHSILSNHQRVKEGEAYWVKVEPIVWLVDERADIALSKNILLSGIPFMSIRGCYNGDFQDTPIKKYLDDIFSLEIMPTDLYLRSLGVPKEKIVQGYIRFVEEDIQKCMATPRRYID